MKHPILFIFLGALLFNSCAKTGTLSGGPVDKQPPQIDSSETTANYQVHFKKQKIELTFDEWIQLKDVFNQVLVSPPLAKRPRVELRGKKVIFEFDEKEELYENTTYTINFGDAVRDLTEGNIVPDLRFVFSTGSFIDSLKVSGTVKDAISKKPVKGVTVMLYDNLADSVVRTERPFYFAKTDKNGHFFIENIKSDTFKVFGLVDENLNYKYDNENEAIGFLVEPVIISDSLIPTITLSLFKETPDIRFLRADNSVYGIMNLQFSGEPFDIDVTHDSLGQYVYVENVKDSIKYWYTNDLDTSWHIYIKKDTILDTIKIFPDTIPIAFAKRNLETSTKTSSRPLSILAGDDIQIEWKHPITKVDTSLLSLQEDTILNRIPVKAYIDSLHSKRLAIQYIWQEEKIYHLECLPGAVTDIYGLSNKDTIVQSYSVSPISKLGSIMIQIRDLDSLQYYIIQLLRKEKVIAERFIFEQETYKENFKNLAAGNYQIKITEDTNGNQRWDTGNYDKKLFPEKIYTHQLEQLRENWEVEANISLTELKKK